MTDNQMDQKAAVLDTYRNLQQTVSNDGLLKDGRALSQALNESERRLAEIRGQGYCYGKTLQPRLAALLARWQQIEPAVREFAIRRGERLAWDIRALQGDHDSLAQAEGMAAEIYLNKLNTELTRLKLEVESVQQQAKQMLEDLPQQLDEVNEQIAQIEKTLRRAADATFPFASDEHLYLAVEAEWKKGRNDKENPDGIFYITDQRIIMEQREKQGGFLGIGGKKVQDLCWQAPLTTVQEITDEKKGLLGGIDLIHIRFGAGGPFGETTIEVKGGINAHTFAAQLKTVLQGGLAAERIDE